MTVRRRDAIAWATGLLLSVAIPVALFAVRAELGRAECSGEYRPFLGSARQTFAIHGCLVHDAGPLIELKKRLRIYNPHWLLVIK